MSKLSVRSSRAADIEDINKGNPAIRPSTFHRLCTTTNRSYHAMHIAYHHYFTLPVTRHLSVVLHPRGNVRSTGRRDVVIATKARGSFEVVTPSNPYSIVRTTHPSTANLPPYPPFEL